MIVALLLFSLALYGFGVVRVRGAGRPFPRSAVVAFVAGLTLIAAALIGPMDDLSDASFSWHMVQHFVLVSIAAPLLVLGAPVRLALAASPPRAASGLARVLGSLPVRVITHPVVAWLQFAAVLYLSHFSPLYEASLENENIHALEHTLYLVSALIFWTPILAVAPAPHAPSHPVRLLSVFLALPMSAFLGFAFYVARHPLYTHYAAHAGALADQQNAGAVMWIAGGGPLFIALLLLVADWGARERRFGAIADASPPP